MHRNPEKIRFIAALALFLPLLILGVGPIVRAEGDAARVAGFTILQLNDVYKVEGLEGGAVGGIARVRTLRHRLEAGGRPVLVLHGGDFLFPSVMSKYLRAEPMVRCLNLLDGDVGAFDLHFVATFGNHEFDDRDPGLLLGRIAQSDFTWVSSNIRYRSGKGLPGLPLSMRLNNVRDDLILDVGGIRVGILGMTIDAQPRDYVVYGYDRPTLSATVRQALARLRAKGAQLIIALTHQEMTEDVRLASDFPAIDLIVGGHEHFYQRRRVGRTWITKADADAKTVITIDVRASAEGPTIEEPHKIDLGPDVEKDPVVESEVQASLAELAKVVKSEKGVDLMEEVGTTENLLEGVEPAVRGRETALGNFLADAVRDRMQTGIALINGGAIRINDDIPAGAPIRNYDLEGIFYYENHLVAFELTGADLLDVLRNSVSRVHLGDGRFLQVSGIRFRYHATGTETEPLYRIEPSDVEVLIRDDSGKEAPPEIPEAPVKNGAPEGIEEKYAPLDLAKRYTASTLDYIWEQGYRDGYAIFSKGRGGVSPVRIDDGANIDWRKVTEEAIAALPNRRVTTRVEGRIRRF